MMSNPGVAAKMFECLYNQDVNINMIATSEIRITVLPKASPFQNLQHF
jgi:aspartate kinase